MIVKILKGKGWYEDLIGETFEVVDRTVDFVLKEDWNKGFNTIWRHIDKNDCKKVKP